MKMLTQIAVSAFVTLGSTVAHADSLRIVGSPIINGTEMTRTYSQRSQLKRQDARRVATEGCYSERLQIQGQELARKLANGPYAPYNVTGVVVRQVEIQDDRGFTTHRQDVDCVVRR